MNLFQVFVAPILGILIAIDVAGIVRRRGIVFLRILRTTSWLVALTLVLNPAATSRISNLLGIGRGADFVFYAFMLIAPFVWFRVQAQLQTLERKTNELARIHALQSATNGKDGNVVDIVE